MKKTDRFYQILAQIMMDDPGHRTKSRIFVRSLAVLVVFVMTYLLVLPAFTLDQRSAAEQGGIDVPAAMQQEDKDTEAGGDDRSAQTEKSDNDSQDNEDKTDKDSGSSQGSDDSKKDEASGTSADDKDKTDNKAEDKKDDEKVGEEKDGKKEALSELVYKGEGYTVTVTAKGTKFPADTELKVKEIERKDDAKLYDSYEKDAKEAIKDEDNSKKAPELAFARFYDITMISDGSEYEPKDPVEVNITYDKDLQKKLKADNSGDVRVIHFAEKKNKVTPEVINKDDIEVKLKQNKMTEATFATESFSVYAIVATTIEKTVLASDGHNYKISVTCGADSGIPEDADLKVEEIKEGSSDYGTYVAGSENALGWEEGSAVYSRLFDIKIVDSNGQKIQPKDGSTVDVRIELDDAEPQNELNVIHFADGSVKGNIVDADADGKTVEFAADGFSVYSIISQESATGATDLDGKSYALIAQNKAALMGEAHPTHSGRLLAKEVNPVVGGSVQVNGGMTLWNFEAVEDRPGWYYVSDGHGNYINITSGAGDGGTVTLGGRQAIYVATKTTGGKTTYQLRNGENQNNSKSVNDYNNRVADGFGAWKAGNGNNEWFGLYETEYLGDVGVTFDANGGSEAAPERVWGLAGDTITLPDYTGTKAGYTFLGWSTGKDLGNTGAQTAYYPLYPAGSSYTLPHDDTTLYAVWDNNSPSTGEFYIRLDGRIPDEPGNYESSAYTGMIKITGAVKEHRWIIDNDSSKPNNGLYVLNEVTSKLNQLPTADQIVANINASSGKLGFRVENRDGAVVVSQITNASVNSNNYNVAVGDSVYVLWYVQKKHSTFHIDGVLLVHNKVNIAYNSNAAGSVSNMPMGYQELPGTDVKIGASGSKNGQVKTPSRPGYIFTGWNTESDGSGTEFQNNDIYTLNEDTTLYAQWSKGKNLMTVAKYNEDDETLAGAQFKLEEKTSSGAYIEKANRTTGANGTFTFDQMENDTLYRMTETYAPNGYEVQNSFFFKVNVDDPDALHLYVCDEDGNPILEPPTWLDIEYIPAEDPRAQGVARIRFNITDERIKRNITFIKTDEDGNPLPGAEYTLSNAKGNVSGVLKEASGSDGIFSKDDAELAYGSYTLTEDKAPVGYGIGSPVTFTLNDYVSETNTGLTITGGDATASCEMSSEVDQGLTVTTYSYTVRVRDIEQPHINVTKQIAVDGDLDPNELNTTIYYALTKKGQEGYVTKDDGEIWIEQMDIVDGVPTPNKVVFDGVDIGEYDVWEMALIDGEYTRMYNGLVVSDNFQLDAVSASSADGGNNANVSADDLEAEVDFINNYGEVTASTTFIANKRWTERDGTTQIDPPEGAVIEFTLYSEKRNPDGQIIEGSEKTVRSIELDGTHDADGEFNPWQAQFRYLPMTDEQGNEYVYKVKETVTVAGYYPNNYPKEYYLTNSNGTITNRRLTTDIELHKHFEIYPEKAGLLDPASMQDLSFTLTAPDGSTTQYTIDDFTASTEDPYDYVLTLEDQPLGEYAFTESGQEDLFSDDGYELVYSVSSAEGESEVGGTEQPVLELGLDNSYAKKGTLVVKKKSIIYEAVDEQTTPAEISGKTFSFVVKRGRLYLQEDGSLGITPYTFSLGEGDFKKFPDVPAGDYTVVEDNAAVEGYIWEVVDGTRNSDGTYSKSLSIDDKKPAGEASFDNRYTKIENGSLTVSKTVVGGPAAADTKPYNVEITTTRHGETVWLDRDGNVTTEQTILTVSKDNPLIFETVPAGTYTVKEDTADAAFDDYSLAVTYSTESPFTIHKDGEAEVDITNTYNYLYTPVKITKEVTGNMGDKNLYFGFDVYVTDANNQPIVVAGVTDENGLIQFNIKDGQERLLQKLPKGAKLTVVEHNARYATTIHGVVGVNETITTDEIDDATVTHHDDGVNSTVSYVFTIPEDGATLDFTNDLTVEKDVVLKKIGYDNRDESTCDLAGATFRIYSDRGKTRPVELDGKTEFTSGEDGVFYAGKLGKGTYYLDETVVPAGYYGPTGMYILTVNENGVTLGSTTPIGQPSLNNWITSEVRQVESEDGNTVEKTVYTVAIRNTAGVALPHTGGMGTTIFYVLGSILLLGSLAVLARRARTSAR